MGLSVIMFTRRTRTLLLAALACASGATAQTVTLSDYFFFKGALYSQTSTADPVPFATDPYYFNVGINGTNASTINPDPTFSGPASGTLTSVSGTRWDYKQGFATKAALDAAFPNGTYTLVINGITPPAGVDLTFGSAPTHPDGYPTNIPKITNTDLTWSGGNLLINPAVTTTLTFTPGHDFTEFLGYTPPPNNPNFRQVLAFFASTGPDPAWKIERSSFAGGEGFDHFDLVSGFLTPGVTYRTVLTYDIYSTYDNTSIAGAEGVAMFSNQLQFYITAVPEPSTIALLSGLAGLSAALWHRARRRAI
jgi:hypothetical protein